MRIAINLRLYVEGKIGGIENYVRNVVAGIVERQDRLGIPVTIFAHEKEMDNVRAFASTARLVPVLHETAASILEEELKPGCYDVLYCPLLVLDPLRPPIPSTVMMPDLQHEFYPEYFDSDTLSWRRQTYRPSALYADVVYTLSEHAKSTIVDRFRVAPEKIEVVYLDVDREFRAPAPAEASAGFEALRLPPEYLFYPANLWPHKNHETLLRAFRMVVEKHPALGLVLTGGDSKGAERVKQRVAEFGLQRNVRMLGYQDRAIVAELFRHARALAFVSKFEGFGIPILEAFHTRTPVITSRDGSCSEVAGNGALLVDVLQPGEIAAAVETILTDPGMRQQLVESGARRAEDFSWQRAIDQTFESFERAVHPAKRSAVQVVERPVVSVVTPTYNMARFLEETIQSVLSQDYPHIDYLVMDGGSNDGTIDILRKYGDRLRYESRPDRGQADAINRGFANSTGQIFAFLNADDTYLPGAVGKAVNHMLANPRMGVVYGEAYHVAEDGNVLAPYPTQRFDAALLNRRCFICQPASFIWRDVFESAGWMNVELHYALDYDLWMRIAKISPMLKVDDFLATSRMHRENKTLGQRRRVYREIIGAVKTHYGYVPFDWVYGYSCYLIDRKDQFFDKSHPSTAKYAASFFLGAYYNARCARRYWKEWADQAGILGGFRGRWDDGWISKSYIADHAVSEDCSEISIAGRHIAPIRDGLTLTVRLDGKAVNKVQLRDHGPFEIRICCPEDVRGKRCQIQIDSNRTFRPVGSGDYRKMSCIIDSMSFDGGR